MAGNLRRTIVCDIPTDHSSLKLQMLRHPILTGVLALSCGAIAVAVARPSFLQAPQATEHHSRLMDAVGTWKGTLSMWIGAPEPMTTECTETVRAVGDLWTTSTFHCSFEGQPFEGCSTNGFDPKKGKYVSTWIDSMTAGLTVMEGEWDDANQAIVMHYEGQDPMTGEMVPMRYESRGSSDSVSTSFFKMVDGKPERSMKIEMHKIDHSEAAEASSDHDR